MCGVNRPSFNSAPSEGSPGKGAVRLLQNTIHDLESKLHDATSQLQQRDTTIKELQVLMAPLLIITNV